MGKVIWTPQPRQAALMARFEDEALYGGAAGGGKSDCALAEALRQVEIPHYRGLILRKTFPQLTELMDRSTEIYRRAYKKARFNESKHVWTFPSGAKIFFGSMQHTKDRTAISLGGVQLSVLPKPPQRAGDPLLHPSAGQPRRRGPRLGEGALHHGGPAHANDLGAVQGPLP